jgi:hypothetical protein
MRYFRRSDWILSLTAIVFGLVGFALLVGGVWLATLGGSTYYFLAALGILTTAALLIARRSFRPICRHGAASIAGSPIGETSACSNGSTMRLSCRIESAPDVRPVRPLQSSTAKASRPPKPEHQRGKAVRAFAKVDGSCRDHHAQRPGRPNHLAACNAPMIAVTIAGSASRQIKTLVPTTSNSIECGRAGVSLFASPVEPLGDAPGSTITGNVATGGAAELS